MTRAQTTEEFKNTIGTQVHIPEEIASNSGRVILPGTYDVIQATGKCLCLGYWLYREDGTKEASYAGWLDYRITEEEFEMWSKGFEEEEALDNNLQVAAEIQDLVLPEWTPEEVAPAAKPIPRGIQAPLGTAPRPVRKYRAVTHGRWLVDENTMECAPHKKHDGEKFARGNDWRILKIVRPGEEWIVTNGRKTGILTQNRWDNIEK